MERGPHGHCFLLSTLFGGPENVGVGAAPTVALSSPPPLLAPIHPQPQQEPLSLLQSRGAFKGCLCEGWKRFQGAGLVLACLVRLLATFSQQGFISGFITDNTWIPSDGRLFREDPACELGDCHEY